MKFDITSMLGVTIAILSFILIANLWSRPQEVQFDATYFLEVNHADAVEFSKNISIITGRGLGYIMGSSNMMSIPTNGSCSNNNDLEAALRQYLGSNQFVCFLTVTPQ